MGAARVPSDVEAAILITIVVAIVALIAHTVRSSGARWYAQLRSGCGAPPARVHDALWIALYASIGLSAYAAYAASSTDDERLEVLRVLVVELTLNLAWTIALFGGRCPRSALIILVPLLALVCYSVARHFAVSALSGWLLVPYALALAYEALLTARAIRLAHARGR
jgi:translocator protein